MKYRHIVLFALFILSIITYLDRVCMNVVSKYIKSDLNINNEQFGYILGAFSLSYALFELPTGMLGDRIGARKVLVRVVLWWSLFTALTASALSFFYLIAVRFLFGIGEAGAYPNASIVISRWFPISEVGRAQSFIWAGSRIGGAFTPLIILPLVHLLGWRFAFVILGIVGAIWATFWLFWFRDEPNLIKGIKEEEIKIIETERQAKTGKHSVSIKVIARNPNIWALILMCHFLFYGAYFFTNWSSTYFQEGRGLSENETKSFISLSYFLGAIGCLTGGYLSDWLVKRYGLKIGRRVVGFGGISLSSLFFLLSGITENNELSGYLLSICVLTKDLAQPVAFATCIDIGKQYSGTVTGAMNFAGQLGGFFITIIFGMIVHSTNNFNYPLYIISGCLLISATLWLVIDPSKSVSMIEAN